MRVRYGAIRLGSIILCSFLSLFLFVPIAKSVDRIKCDAPDAGPTLEIVGKPSLEKGITLKGRGWCTDYSKGGDGASEVAIKFNYGGVKHVNTNVYINKSVWFIVKNAKPATGDFNITVPLPGGSFLINRSFSTAFQGSFNPKDFYVTGLAGSLTPHAYPASVTRHFQDVWRPPAGYARPDNRPYPVESIGDIQIVPDNVKHELKVLLPSLKPGDWVQASYSPIVGSPEASTDEILADPDGWFKKAAKKNPCGVSWGLEYLWVNYWVFSEAIGDIKVIEWRQVSADKTVTLPLEDYKHDKKSKEPYDARKGIPDYGPAYIYIVHAHQDPVTGDDLFDTVGHAFVTNIKRPANDKYPDFTGVGYIPYIVPGIRRDLLDLDWPKAVRDSPETQPYQCWFNSSAEADTVAFPVAPVVRPDRSIRVPEIPGVDYYLGGRKVTGILPKVGPAAQQMRFEVKPRPGYRLIGKKRGGHQVYVLDIAAYRSAPVKPDFVSEVDNRPGNVVEVTPSPQIIRTSDRGNQTRSIVLDFSTVILPVLLALTAFFASAHGVLGVPLRH